MPKHPRLLNLDAAASLAVLTVAAGVAGFFISRQIRQPLVADEPQFVDIAKSLMVEARPMAYAGSRWRPILTHPQLYHALLTVPAALGAKAPWAPRLVGIAAYAATALGLWFAVRRETNEYGGPALAAVFYLWHPLALQSSLLVEIDTAVLPLLTIAFVYYLQRRDFSLGGAGWVGLGLLTGVLWCAKLTTPTIMLAALGLYYIIIWRPRGAAGVAGAASVGGALFLLYFLPYVALRGLPLLMPITHSLGRATTPCDWATLASRGAKLALWLGPPTVVLFAALGIKAVRERFRGPSPAAGFAWCAAAALTVFYLFIGGDGYGFVKYHAPLVGLIALPLGVAVGPALARANRKVLAFLFLLALAYYALYARDPLFAPYTAKEAELVWLQPLGSIRKSLFLAVVTIVLPLPVFAVITRPGGRTAAFTVLALAAAISLDGWQAFAPYNVRYNYGERGQEEAVGALREVDPKLNVIVPIDVAFNHGYRHKHLAVESLLTNETAFYEALKNPTTAAVVLRDAYYLHQPYTKALSSQTNRNLLENSFTLRRYGSFVVGVKPPVTAVQVRSPSQLYKPSEVLSRSPK